MTNTALGPGGEPSVQLETRAAAEVTGTALKERFVAMNEVVNEVFFGIIEGKDSGWSRFGGLKQ